MNNLLLEFIDGLIDFLVANPGSTRAQAIDHLQTETNGVSQSDGGAWIDAMAVYGAALGWNGNGTFSNMRNKIEGDAVEAKAFWDTVAMAMVNDATFNTDPVVPGVTQAIRLFDLERRRTRLQEQIQFIIGARDALPTPTTPTTNREENAMRRAYNQGLQDMRAERDNLDSRIGANS